MKNKIMKYLSGEEILVGDEVLIENGKTTGIVETIIESQKEMEQWNVEESGVLIKAAPFGLVFWPHSNSDDPIVFQKHENT
jgi:hypothetical protein